jgi:hypothetical protein
MTEKVVREFPEVESVVTKIGRPDLATEVYTSSLRLRRPMCGRSVDLPGKALPSSGLRPPLSDAAVE